MDADAEREFRDYVAARQAALFRTALLLTGHRQDAEDLLQTAFVKLATRWTRVRRADSPDAYVRKILYHQQVGRWRRSRHRREYATTDVPEVNPAADPAGDAVLRLSLAQALGQLTPKQRAVIVLRYYEDLPEAEVAEILGCAVGTVRSQTHRTLARLRASFPELALTMETR
jgi:RNA polymerase sigma-70 factor (sigma-E family)